jgi:UDPglucose 6-dehydrogenase
MDQGVTVRVYDQAALEECMKLQPGIIPCSNAYETARDADALVLMMERNEFRNLDFVKLNALMSLLQ